jgi:arylsulfatase A-like enzyme
MWFDHHGLYDTNLRVPLLLWRPGRIPAGARVDSMVNLLDLTPTLLELAGMPEVAEQEGMLGRSLVPILDMKEGGDTDQSKIQNPKSKVQAPGTWDAIYCTECTWLRKRGWRTPEWKLIRALEEDIYGNPMVELYDLGADPGEQHNLAESRPEVVQELEEQMNQWVSRRRAATGLPDPSIDQADALRIWQPRFIAGNPQWKKVLLKGRNALLRV